MSSFNPALDTLFLPESAPPGAERSFLMGYDLDLDKKSLIVGECVSGWLPPDVASTAKEPMS
jgi:hypothetical protein